MSGSPRVSVCLLSYNHARFLPEAIESALAQTYRNFEILIVDDGSKDESLEIAQSYASRFPFLIRVFTHPGHSNHGISASGNLAFRQSRGEFWSGLASDDVWYSDKLEKQVTFLDLNPEIGFVYSYADVIDETGAKLPGGSREEDVSNESDPIGRLLHGNVISGGTSLVRRECFNQVGLHDESLVYSDWELWIRILAHWKVAFMNCALAKYRHHGGNTSVGASMKTHIERAIEVMRALNKKAKVIGGRLSIPRTRALINLQMSYLLFCEGDDTAARTALSEAFEADANLISDSDYFKTWLRDRLSDPHEPQADRLRIHFTPWVITSLPEIAGMQFANTLRRELNADVF